MTPSMRESVDDLAGVPATSPLSWLVTLALLVAVLVGLCGDARSPRPPSPSVPESCCGTGAPSPSPAGQPHG